jgi:RND family efflux transporter MFP subunit
MSLETKVSTASLLMICAVLLSSCGNSERARVEAAAKVAGPEVSVGVVAVGRMPIARTLTLSSELVPFQQIDVYAKESGFVKELKVDYGSHVKAGDLIATLEIPELEAQLQQDDAAIKNAADQVTHAERQLDRVEAQHQVAHLMYTRLSSVAKAKPGLVAQQEVDEKQGQDLASEAQVESAKANLQSAQSELAQAQAKRVHDQALFDYSKITAPFTGVITQRYANLGTMVQGGTTGTNALPIVQLSEDDVYRLVIPVPESYVRYIRIGDPVRLTVPSLDRTFPGKVARFAVNVKEDTRTMHTEVDVPNPGRVLYPGLYADATITLERKNDALAVPLTALNRSGGRTTVYVVGPSNTIEERQVTLGVETADYAEIVSGLHEGEKIVTSDRSGLKAGEVVRPQAMNLIQYQSDNNKQ